MVNLLKAELHKNEIEKMELKRLLQESSLKCVKDESPSRSELQTRQQPSAKIEPPTGKVLTALDHLMYQYQFD